MGNPDGDNTTCAGPQTASLFDGVDPEVLAEMMRAASATVAERKLKEKEARDAAIAKCEATIEDLDPKIAALESKIDQTVEQIKTATCERDDAERTIAQSDIELAETTYQYEKVIPLKDRYDATKKKFDAMAEDTATANTMRVLIIKLDRLDEQYFPLEKKYNHLRVTLDTVRKECSCNVTDGYCRERDSWRGECGASKRKWDQMMTECANLNGCLQPLRGPRESIISEIKKRWDTMKKISNLPYPSDKSRFDKMLEMITKMRTESSLEFEEVKTKYLKMCFKFPEDEHESIRSKYPDAISASKHEYKAYKSARIQLAHLNNKLNRHRDKLDELKRQRKEAAAELETLGVAC